MRLQKSNQAGRTRGAGCSGENTFPCKLLDAAGWPKERAEPRLAPRQHDWADPRRRR